MSFPAGVTVSARVRAGHGKPCLDLLIGVSAMELADVRVGQWVRVRDGYGWTVQVHDYRGLLRGSEWRDMGGHVTQVLEFVHVLTSEYGWVWWPQVSKGCLAFHIDPMELTLVSERDNPGDETESE